MHNSRQPLDFLTFDLIFIGWQGIVMDYPCAKFGDFSFCRFRVIVLTNRRNHRGRSMLYLRNYSLGRQKVTGVKRLAASVCPHSPVNMGSKNQGHRLTKCILKEIEWQM